MNELVRALIKYYGDPKKYDVDNPPRGLVEATKRVIKEQTVVLKPE